MKTKLVFTDEDYAVITAMGNAGWDLERIATSFGTTKKGIENMMKDDKNLSRAVRNGVELSIVAVANALYKKSTGYDYFEEHYTVNDSGEEVLVKKIKKHVQPDAFAANSYLYNRDPGNWKQNRTDTEKPKLNFNISMSGKQFKELTGKKKPQIEEAQIVED